MAVAAAGADDATFEWLSDYVLHFLKSPTWVSPIAQFVDERCIIFDNEEENKLEYTKCHMEFKQLIDDLMAAHLLELSVSPQQFEQFCRSGLVQNPTLHRVLVEQLLSIDDFLTFKAMMTKRNADLYREALRQVESAEGARAAAQLQASPEQDDATKVIEEYPKDETVTGNVVAQEWQLYEDQLFRDLRVEGDQQFEVELEQAIALSLQVEEERKQQQAAAEAAEADMVNAATAASSTQSTMPPPTTEPAPAIPSTPIAEPVPIVEPVPVAVEVAQMPIPEQVPVAQPVPVQAEPTPEPAIVPAQPPAPQPVAAAEPAPPAPVETPMRPVLHGGVRLEPISSRANLPPTTGVAVRAVPPALPAVRAPVVKAAAPAPAPVVPTPVTPAPATPLPTEEERKQRAEHLRRQRELLVAKRNQERQRQVEEFQKAKGRSAADSVVARGQVDAAGSGNAAGRQLMTELSGAGATNAVDASAAPLADTQVAAVQMRQALTVQLRQTLTNNMK